MTLRSRHRFPAVVGAAALTSLSAWPGTMAPGMSLPVSDPELPLNVAQSEEGMVYLAQPSGIREHPLGYSVHIRGWSPRSRPVQQSVPGSPEFRFVESFWVVDCSRGTFAIVEDRFLDASGRPVAVFAGSAEEQDAPGSGSVAAAILTSLCRYIGHGR
jgi:hypothetical protein